MNPRKWFVPFWLLMSSLIVAGLLLYYQSIYAPEESAKRFLSRLKFDDLITLKPTDNSRIYSLEREREFSRPINYKVIDRENYRLNNTRRARLLIELRIDKGEDKEIFRKYEVVLQKGKYSIYRWDVVDFRDVRWE